MARIILTEVERDMTPSMRLLVDTTSKFSDSLTLKKRIVKEPDGTIHFVKETLEEISQLIFEAEVAEKNATLDCKKQKVAMEKSVEIQEEMLEIMQFLVKKLD